MKSQTSLNSWKIYLINKKGETKGSFFIFRGEIFNFEYRNEKGIEAIFPLFSDLENDFLLCQEPSTEKFLSGEGLKGEIFLSKLMERIKSAYSLPRGIHLSLKNKDDMREQVLSEKEMMVVSVLSEGVLSDNIFKKLTLPADEIKEILIFLRKNNFIHVKKVKQV